MDAFDRARSYGVHMNENLSVDEVAALREQVNHDIEVDWNDPTLKTITRFRIIGCSGYYPYWDVSYCYGQLKDGTHVRVHLPFYRLPRNWKPAVLEAAKRDGVYAKGIGIFDNVSQLWG